MKIKEIIVCEGKNDSNVLKSYFDCDTIETHGTCLSKSTLETIRLANQKRGVIIFTDPDAPGDKIRNIINQAIPNCKNAFIDKNKAKTSKKVGIEHASREDLEFCLSHLMSYVNDIEESINYEQFMELGLTGKKDSAYKREKLGYALFIGKANAKTLFKRLNMIQITQIECKKILEDFS